MPALTTAEPRNAELTRALDEAGKKEYRRMARVAHMARGRFHLFPVECDFTLLLRAAFLDRLRGDLAANGLRLRVVTLTHACWNALAALEQEAPILPGDVVILTGLEATPHIVRETGTKPQRPPALAALNQLRETLRQQIAAPFFIWCPSYAYTALLEHAPDFFDQYTAKFRFTNASPQHFQESFAGALGIGGYIEENFVSNSSFGSQVAVDFHRNQVSANPTPTPKRAVALLNLAIELLRLSVDERGKFASEAKTCIDEAAHLLAKRRDRHSRYSWAMCQYALGLLHTYFLFDEQNINLKQAINCYKAALHVYSATEHPKQWASTQYCLGIAYAKSPHNKGGQNLQSAITYYKAALHIYTEMDYPTEWARTQYGLGWAYSHLPSENQQINKEYSIACYESALRVFTEAKHTTEWANTHIHLALANFALSTHVNTDNIHKAIANCEAALRVYTAANNMQMWAIAHNILGELFKSAGDIPTATTAFQQAMRGYSESNDAVRSQEMEVELQKLAVLPVQSILWS